MSTCVRWCRINLDLATKHGALSSYGMLFWNVCLQQEVCLQQSRADPPTFQVHLCLATQLFAD